MYTAVILIVVIADEYHTDTAKSLLGTLLVVYSCNSCSKATSELIEQASLMLALSGNRWITCSQ